MILKTLAVGPFACNTYIVGSEKAKECFIIDPGAEGKRILEEVKALGLKVLKIVNTHGHSDHTGAVATVKDATGAEYGIGAGDAPMLKDSFLRDMVPDFREPPQPDLLLKGGEEIKAGELSFLVLATPGHTPGSICIHGHGMVFTGDTLFRMSIGRSDFAGGNQARLLDSIATKLTVLPEDTLVYPGHGPETTIGIEKKMNPFLTGRFRMLER